MGKFIDLTGQIFGRITVLKYSHKDNSHHLWICECVCGKNTLVRTNDLRRGKVVSCGCKKRDNTIDRNSKHGQSKTSEYRSWKAIKTRCYNPKVKSYADYGARSIIMCDRWLDSFENFIADMGPKPSPDHSVDRINHDGNYEPVNCRWADKKQQNRNTRQNHLLNTQWGLITLAEAVERSGVSLSTIKARIKRGIPETQLLNII